MLREVPQLDRTMSKKANSKSFTTPQRKKTLHKKRQVEENMILLEKDEKESAVMCCEERLQDGCWRFSTSCCSSRKTRSRMPPWMPRDVKPMGRKLRIPNLKWGSAC
ncbi:uncharacterized protein LOC143269407 [Peromyscus maniculatus bairdii]|uniref:uncharacterized protein LOC143269407 n=1 Tax=Peromyscus maniculatus bairdii TaxID=230844 RepID=UPI003FD31842